MDLELIKNKLRYPQEYGQATPEEAKFAFDNGYMGGEKTQEYYRELGILDPKPAEPEPQTQAQPQEPTLQFTDNPNGAQGISLNNLKTPDILNPFGAQQDPEAGLQNKLNATLTNGAIDPTKLAEQEAADKRQQDLNLQLAADVQQSQEKAAKRQQALDWWAQQGRNLQTASEGVGEGVSNIAKYVPMSAAVAAQNQLTGGVDRSGEAAGYEGLAAQNQYQAAQNEKLRQANMQQAMDNTIADKMAAAEAESKWKQNARALREGGAQAVASQNEAVTPDLWKQKQLQNERRDVAAQNLAEVDKNRRQAIQNETKASMTNYNTRVNDNLNMRANALSVGGAEDKDEDTKKEDTETKTEDTGTTETKTEDTGTKSEGTETQPEGTTSTAPSNQESEGTETATDKVAMDNIITQVNALNDRLKNKDYSTTMLTEYNNLKEQYNALKDKVDNPPVFPEMWKPSDDSTDVSNIASTIDDLTM